MIYQWKAGSRMKIDANVAGKVCEDLADKHNLTAKALLDASRPPDAPLHGAFEWDDGVAAEKYREDQARAIIRSLTVVHASAEPVRGFFIVKKADPTYQPIHVILQRQDTTELLLQQALGEFMAVRRKYANLTQLAGVFTAIDQAIVDHHDGSLPDGQDDDPKED